MNKIYALVDCNNFFASCERIFDPKLNNKPVIVLSNNDGCIIARSNEAKKIGIKMGEPYFKAKEICQKEGVSVFSSNYQLYGDISQRVMSIVNNFTPNMEIYSIDEAFLDLTGLDSNLNEYAKEIIDIVQKWTGIPISVGIGPTKTLAKLANYFAKKYMPNGICDLTDNTALQRVLKLVDVKEIWGIGSKWAIKLNAFGINTAEDLARSDPRFIKNSFNVVVEKIVYELRGLSCIEMEIFQPRKNITSSRSFGIPITEMDDLDEAIANYVSRAAIRLREQNSYAQAVYVYLQTNKYNKNLKQLHESITIKLDFPINNTAQLVSYAKKCLGKIYKKGYRYKKCGVILLDLIDKESIQDGLFKNIDQKKEQVLLKMMDGINSKMGKDTLSYASMGVKKVWEMKRNLCSHRYTTSWKELPSVI